MKAKISVIIPVYNVENYLKRCLDSIINQTYKNLEIILINDGSTDSSGMICDEYKKNDRRIKVIHKKNEGQSKTRNRGIDIATGEYISFIDSDDFIHKDFYKELMNLIKTNESTLAICGYQMFTKEEELKENKSAKKTKLSKSEALGCLFDKQNYKIENYLCNKLYHRDLFTEIRMPINDIYEDISIMYKLFDKATNISFISKDMYYYFQRANSSSRKVSVKNITDRINITIERKKYIDKKYPELIEKTNYYSFKASIVNFLVIARNKDRETYFSNLMNREYINYKNYIKTKGILKALKYEGKSRKILGIILYINKTLFYFLISNLFRYKK